MDKISQDKSLLQWSSKEGFNIFYKRVKDVPENKNSELFQSWSFKQSGYSVHSTGTSDYVPNIMSTFVKPFSSVNPFDQSKEWYIGKLSWKAKRKLWEGIGYACAEWRTSGQKKCAGHLRNLKTLVQSPGMEWSLHWTAGLRSPDKSM